MSEKIVQLNEEVIEGKSKNWFGAVSRNPSMSSWRQKLKN